MSLAARITYWIAVLDACRQLKNFHSAMCLYAALHKSPISSLKKTWSLVSKVLFRSCVKGRTALQHIHTPQTLAHTPSCVRTHTDTPHALTHAIHLEKRTSPLSSILRPRFSLITTGRRCSLKWATAHCDSCICRSWCVPVCECIVCECGTCVDGGGWVPNNSRSLPSFRIWASY